MWVALAFSAIVFPHSVGWTTMGHYHLQGWDMRITHDRFSGQALCAIKARGVRLRRDTLIFKMGRSAETIDAHFRIDGGPVRSAREALALDEARGFFPDRGWIENPSESEVALPASYALGAQVVYIRANIHSRPRAFRVAGLADVARSAAAMGCAAGPV